jgi:hypothetical protein
VFLSLALLFSLFLIPLSVIVSLSLYLDLSLSQQPGELSHQTGQELDYWVRCPAGQGMFSSPSLPDWLSSPPTE